MPDRPIKKRVDMAFRQGAVAMVRDSDRSFTDIAKGLGVHVSTLRYWYDQEMAKKGSKPAITARTPARLRADATVAESLPEENARLRAELKAALRKLDEVEEEKQILKKATANSMGRCNTVFLPPRKGRSARVEPRIVARAAGRTVGTVENWRVAK